MQVGGFSPIPGAGGSLPSSSPFLELQRELQTLYTLPVGSDKYNQQVSTIQATLTKLEGGNYSPVLAQALKNISDQFGIIVQLAGSNQGIEQDILRIQSNPPMTPAKATEIVQLDRIMASNTEEINTAKQDIAHDFSLLMSAIIS
jgi:hypothetical protein